MSTHQFEIYTFGLNWLGKNHDIYKSSKLGNFYNTATEDPPLPCFNCNKMHWRKNCPQGILHGFPKPKKCEKFKISKILFDDE